MNSNSRYGLYNYTDIIDTSSAAKTTKYWDMWIYWILYCLYVNYTCVSVSHIHYVTCNYVIITFGLVIRISKEDVGTILKTPVSTSFILKLHLASPSDKELISYPCSQIQKTLY